MDEKYENDDLEKFVGADVREALKPRGWTVEHISTAHRFMSFLVSDASGRTYDLEIFAQS